MQRPVGIIVLGGGGHAKVVIDALRASGRRVIGFVDPDPKRYAILGAGRLGDDNRVFEFRISDVALVNGIGSVTVDERRRRIFNRFRQYGYRFDPVIHPAAVVASDVKLGEGAQVMAGAVVQAGSNVRENTIVNTRASLDHDCDIGPHAHVAPGVTLSGNVRVGEQSHIGTGACVIQGVIIGSRSVIGAGAVVIQNVPDGVTVAGVPAREIVHAG